MYFESDADYEGAKKNRLFDLFKDTGSKFNFDSLTKTDAQLDEQYKPSVQKAKAESAAETERRKTLTLLNSDQRGRAQTMLAGDTAFPYQPV